MRAAGSSYGTPARSILRNPPSSPIRAHLLRALAEDPPVVRRVAGCARVGRRRCRRRRRDRLRELAPPPGEALAAGAVRVVVAGDGGAVAGALRLGRRKLGKHALVVDREDLDELL